jgi:glyoxylase-like metal-dependent hydrolase (beta-lactamase superfamily II)
MKISGLIFLLLLGFLVLFPINLSAEPVNDMEYCSVSPSVIMARHQYGANMTCLATDQGLYFVDCGMKTELARKFRTDMEEKFRKKTLALLITHPHIDHFFGMAAFSDVNVVAAEPGKNLWEKQLAIKFNDRLIEAYTRIFPKFRESQKSAKLFMPTLFFKDMIQLGEGEDKLIFTNTGGHTVCSSSVYFPKENILVAGDLIQVDQYPYFGDPTNDMDAWLSAFKKWQTLPIQKICPGHGRVVDKAYIGLMKDYFERLIEVLKGLKAQNLETKDVIRHPDLPAGYWGDQAERPAWFNYCMASLYQKL